MNIEKWKTLKYHTLKKKTFTVSVVKSVDFKE